ncbi:lanC-like protein 3 homolog [Drosophila obscura]|uniref:lanC-like protein 3 homolog n=1 Tax=Drosophila obscura TaxID=7282 RepID=UPI001BB2C80D|nr:lanC-like protein 3 homolog [Drosophila obscura]
MNVRYIKNPYPDFPTVGANGVAFALDEERIRDLISAYVKSILEQCKPRTEERGDLYVGNAGIAYMFWKLQRSEHTRSLCPTALQHAAHFIAKARGNAERLARRTSLQSYSFVCGTAGIHAVSAAIAAASNEPKQLAKDLASFKAAATAAASLAAGSGCDELLVGRAGYLAGCYWLNDILPADQRPIPDEALIAICQSILASGRAYSTQNHSPMPLMYQYHGTEYLGAAHGLCGILQMLLASPWFRKDQGKDAKVSLFGLGTPADVLHDVKRTVDCFLTLQDAEGNFPVALEDGGEQRLVHWCHGAPGIVYLLAKAYLLFQEPRYLLALRRSADFVWRRGVLRKGPGLCHGVAGNGYVFLLLFRLTHDMMYLYRAHKFMELLDSDEFRQQARVPDRPHSLYEGVAGTVCFLADLLEPEQAHFPFMDVFY